MLRQLLVYLQNNPGQIAPFSAKVGIGQQFIYELVSGEKQPSFEQLSIIASKFKVSLSQLLAESNEKIKFHFRTNVESINQFIVSEKVNHIINSIHPIVSKYSDRSHIPEKDKFDLSERVDAAADLIRVTILDDTYERPLLDLAERICKGLNIYLIVKDVGADGASAFIDGYAYIIISPRFPARMLFTLAHELGHLVLQHHQNEIQIDFSHVGNFDINPENRMEAFANSFASNILMPDNALARLILQIKESNNVPDSIVSEIEILICAFYFGVSFEAAAMRCEQLGFIHKGAAHMYYGAIKKEYKSPELRGRSIGLERSNPVFPLGASTNVLLAMFKAIDEGEVSASKAANVIGVKLPQLFDLHSNLSDGLYN